MSTDLEIFSSTEIKDIVQDMRDLLSQSHLSFLIGAGCSKIAGLPLVADFTNEVLTNHRISKETKRILNNVCKSFSGANFSTIEDYMSEIVDLLSIAERRSRRGATLCKVNVGKCKKTSNDLYNTLDEIKQAILFVISNKEVDISTHQKFIRAVHNSLQAGKAERCVDYFVLN